MSVVEDDERSAAGGITNIVRSIGLSVSPLFVGYLLSDPNNRLLFGMPFIVSGVLKCLYDILLYTAFQCSKQHKDPIPTANGNGHTSNGNKSETVPVQATTKYQSVPTSDKE